MNSTPVIAVELGLLSVTVRVDVPASAMVDGLKLVLTAGAVRLVKVTLAVEESVMLSVTSRAV